METRNATDLMDTCYQEYGKYVNSTRAVTGFDGLKAVERRVLLAARDVAVGKLVGTVDVVAAAMTKYHPHGSASVEPVVYKAIHRGFLEGEGNFGLPWMMEPIDAAAPRYTKVRVNQAFNDAIFELADYVPQFMNEQSYMEPEYLPTPIPLDLTVSSSGIGLGLLNTLPAFSARSMFDAMKANDPKKLRAPDGLDLVIDSEDLTRVWTHGQGRLFYKFKATAEWHDLDNKWVTVITGNSAFVKPTVYDEFKNELLDSSVYIRDESSASLRLVVSRVKGLKRFTDEDILERCVKACTIGRSCRLYVTERGVTSSIGLRDWLKGTWSRYEKAVAKYKADKLSKLTAKLELLQWIPKVAPLIVEQKSQDEIVATLGVPKWIVQEIEGKPIRILRKANFDDEIKRVGKEIKDITSVTADKLANNLIDVIEASQKLKESV